MVKEISKLILGVLIILGTIYAIIAGRAEAVQYLVGLVGVIVGYYFKDVQDGLTSRFLANKNK